MEKKTKAIKKSKKNKTKKGGQRSAKRMKTEQGFAINTKHLKSQILVEDGGTVVIGGIYLQTEREDIVKIPLLGDIPYFGKFFQHQTKLKDKTELLVFLTPSLIDHHGRYLNNPK